MTHVEIDLGQHWLGWWLVVWRNQATTWTNIDLIGMVLWHSSESHFALCAHATILYDELENYTFEITAISQEPMS